ncbi:hypothetical protein BHE90_000280 [Fusarium euwallaceae]|uniref:Uncharacterized protein n=1 Tax=Fusarium euwallaceae TaxID=1147111 RepID=A0A430MB31_9HYPO|nr:hypothetical protein BHE90_000280 [Fusarium euwallaceae]
MGMKQCLFPFNAYLSILVLLFRSQEERMSWAPIATCLTLLAWKATGIALLTIHREFVQMLLMQLMFRALVIWGLLVFGLQPSVTDMALLFPVATTMSVISNQGQIPPARPLLLLRING